MSLLSSPAAFVHFAELFAQPAAGRSCHERGRPPPRPVAPPHPSPPPPPPAQGGPCSACQPHSASNLAVGEGVALSPTPPPQGRAAESAPWLWWDSLSLALLVS